MARGYKSGYASIRVQLERDLQSAGVLAGVGGLLVDPGVLDDEEANTEHDQVQVRSETINLMLGEEKNR